MVNPIGNWGSDQRLVTDPPDMDVLTNYTKIIVNPKYGLLYTSFCQFLNIYEDLHPLLGGLFIHKRDEYLSKLVFVHIRVQVT